jgi:broad specificity phosphatase PhoE
LRPARLYLVRHGPTHAQGMVGWTDLPADLSDRETIARLSAFLPADAPVVSSDLARARATADAIAGARPRLPDEPGLRELNFGAWEMRRYAEIERESPELLRDFYEAPGPVRAPAGESWDDLAARVNATLDRLLRARRGGVLIVVAHFGVILTQVARAGRLDARAAFAHRIDPLSVTIIEAAGEAEAGMGWRLLRVNHAP